MTMQLFIDQADRLSLMLKHHVMGSETWRSHKHGMLHHTCLSTSLAEALHSSMAHVILFALSSWTRDYPGRLGLLEALLAIWLFMSEVIACHDKLFV